MRVFCVFFCFFRAKIWPAAAGTGELARDLRDQTHEAMKIGPWVARKRRAFWEARFAVAVANCNDASMISRSQHITD